MVSPLVIQDSDEEDIDFSPIKPPPAVVVLQTSSEDVLITTPAPGQKQSEEESGATDPSFFKKVWLEQQDSGFLPSATTEASAKGKEAGPENGVVAKVKSSSSIPEAVLARVAAQQQRLERNIANLSPLTEITTPTTPSSGNVQPLAMGTRNRGPRQTPNMAESKVYGKKRRGQQSSPTWPPPDMAMPSPSAEVVEDASPAPAKKRRRTSQAAGPQGVDFAPIHDEVDMVVVPMTEELPQRSTNSSRKKDKQRDSDSGIIEETILEVSLESNAMSASQRKLFKTFTSSTDNANESPGQLPTLNHAARLEDQKANQTSSGAGTVSTVPFTTPSEYASPARREALASSEALPAMQSSSTRKRRAPRELMPPSSPDVITETSSRTRTKQVIQSSPRNDSWNSEDIGFERDRYKPRLSRRRAAAVAAEDDDLPDTSLVGNKSLSDLPDTAPAGHKTSSDPLAPVASRDAATRELDHGITTGGSNDAEPIMIDSSPPQKPVTQEIENSKSKQPKKRGRKKKESTIATPLASIDEQGGMVELDLGASVASETQSGKKKRGRPRKSETSDSVATVEVADSWEIEEASMKATRGSDQTETAASDSATIVSKSSKKRRQKEHIVHEDVTESALEASTVEPGVLEEKSSNIMDTGSSAVLPDEKQADDHTAKSRGSEENEEVKPGKKEEVVHEQPKPIVKTENKAGQTGKVPYRVGLSKRSRIAPLLKIVRK